MDQTARAGSQRSRCSWPSPRPLPGIGSRAVKPARVGSPGWVPSSLAASPVPARQWEPGGPSPSLAIPPRQALDYQPVSKTSRVSVVVSKTRIRESGEPRSVEPRRAQVGWRPGSRPGSRVGRPLPCREAPGSACCWSPAGAGWPWARLRGLAWPGAPSPLPSCARPLGRKRALRALTGARDCPFHAAPRLGDSKPPARLGCSFGSRSPHRDGRVCPPFGGRAAPKPLARLRRLPPLFPSSALTGREAWRGDGR